MPLIGKETCLCEGKKSISYYLNNSYLIYSQTNKEGEWCSAYSKYHDVFLSETEYGELKQEIRELDSLIEELSSYMCSSGKYYADYTQSP